MLVMARSELWGLIRARVLKAYCKTISLNYENKAPVSRGPQGDAKGGASMIRIRFRGTYTIAISAPMLHPGVFSEVVRQWIYFEDQGT